MDKEIKNIFKKSQLSWGQQYPPHIASSIPTGSAYRQFFYAPDFAGANPAHGVGPGQPFFVPPVTIIMQGSRRADFAAANNLSGLWSTPRGYTWHHLFEGGGLAPGPVQGSFLCDMQLVNSAMHRRTCAHQGSVVQWERQTGTRYRSVREKDDNGISFTKNTLPIEPCICAGRTPEVVTMLTDKGYLGGNVTINVNRENVDLLFHWTYGEMTEDQLDLYCDSFAMGSELLKLGIYPIGEDEGGNLLFWHGNLNTLWLYDHEGSIEPEESSNFFDLGFNFEDLFPGAFDDAT